MNRNNKKIHRKLVAKRQSVLINKVVAKQKRLESIEQEIIDERNKVLTNILAWETLKLSQASTKVLTAVMFWDKLNNGHNTNRTYIDGDSMPEGMAFNL